jgi:hypothetical protein
MPLAARLIDLAIALLPPGRRQWGKAARAELDVAEEDGRGLNWAVGVLAMSAGMLIAHLLLPWRRAPDEPPPFRAAALVGVALLFAPSWFVGGAILDQMGAPFLFAPFQALADNPHTHWALNNLWPPVLIGAILIALWINAGTSLQIGLGRDSYGRAVRLSFRLQALNMAALALGALLLLAIAGHMFSEMFVYAPH